MSATLTTEQRTFVVTVVRTITTEIEVAASSAAEAKRTIASYGLTEAVSDFLIKNEDVSAKIKSVQVAA